MANYQKFFEDADIDKSGFLTLDELIGLLRKKGYKESDAQIKVGLLILQLSYMPIAWSKWL